MNPVPISVEIRTKTGKGNAHAVRREGLVPGSLYGRGIEAVMVNVSPDLLSKALDNPYRHNTLLAIDTGEAKYNGFVKDVQYHPVTRRVLHVDFYALQEGQVVEWKVPLSLVGKAVGVTKGGQLFKLRRDLSVLCSVDNLPEVIELDVTKMDVDDRLLVRDLPKLEGVTYTERDNIPVAQVGATRDVAAEEAEAAAAEEAEGEEVAEGEAAEDGEGGDSKE